MSEKKEGQKQQSDTVKLDFADWRYQEWTFDVDGEKFSIEKGGSDVPADKEDAVKKAAQEQGEGRQGIKLKKVS